MARPARGAPGMVSDRRGGEEAMMITAHDHPTARVSLNGEDISRNCFAAVAETGQAVIFKRNENGEAYLSWPTCGHKVRISGCACETFIGAIQAEIITGDI